MLYPVNVLSFLPQALVLDMAGVGVTWENLWSGPGVPFGGSLIMMALDTVLYGLIAYWLDAVLPSELINKCLCNLYAMYWRKSLYYKVSLSVVKSYSVSITILAI